MDFATAVRRWPSLCGCCKVDPVAPSRSRGLHPVKRLCSNRGRRSSRCSLLGPGTIRFLPTSSRNRARIAMSWRCACSPVCRMPGDMVYGIAQPAVDRRQDRPMASGAPLVAKLRVPARVVALSTNGTLVARLARAGSPEPRGYGKSRYHCDRHAPACRFPGWGPAVPGSRGDRRRPAGGLAWP